MKSIDGAYEKAFIEYVTSVNEPNTNALIRSYARFGVHGRDAWQRPDVMPEERDAYERSRAPMIALQMERFGADGSRPGVPRRKITAMIVPGLEQLLRVHPGVRTSNVGAFNRPCNDWILNIGYDCGGRSNPGMLFSLGIFRNDVARHGRHTLSSLGVYQVAGVGFPGWGFGYEISSEDDIPKVLRSLEMVISHLNASMLKATDGLGIDD